MWMNNASHSDDIGFFRTLCHLRVAANKFLVHGRLWRPPAVHALPPTTTMVCDFGTFGSTTPIDPAMCCNISNALVSVWADQNGSHIGVAMVNHGAELVQLVVDIALPPALQSKKTLIGRSLGSTGSVPTTIPTQRSADGTSAQLVHKLSALTGAVFELLCPYISAAVVACASNYTTHTRIDLHPQVSARCALNCQQPTAAACASASFLS